MKGDEYMFTLFFGSISGKLSILGLLIPLALDFIAISGVVDLIRSKQHKKEKSGE